MALGAWDWKYVASDGLPEPSDDTAYVVLFGWADIAMAWYVEGYEWSLEEGTFVKNGKWKWYFPFGKEPWIKSEDITMYCKIILPEGISPPFITQNAP